MLNLTLTQSVGIKRHPKCKGTYDAWNGDYDCEYQTAITCDECKYGAGRKDPEAKCNQPDNN